MRKLKLFKSLVVAAAMILGGVSSAWAQTTYFSQDYEADGATPDWTTGTGGRFTPVILEESGNHYLSVNQAERNNNGCTLSSTSLQGKVAAGTDFTMTFDMKIGSSTNQTPVEFNIYDAANSAKILALVATGTYATTYTVNGNSDQKPVISEGGGKGLSELTWMSFKLTRKESLTYLTITNKSTNAVVFERAIISTLSENGGLGKMEFVTKRYNANFAIDNVIVREIQDGDVPAAVATTYTIKYVDESNQTLKEDVIVNSIAGVEVKASNDQIAAIYVNGKKYIYKSGNETITTVENASSNVITLVYREAAVWNYLLTANSGETVIKTIASGTTFEGEQLTVGYPLYVLNDEGALLTKGATNSEYRTTFTVSEDNFNQKLSYVAPSTAIENVVFYTEGEDINGAGIFNTGNSQARSSNAASGYSSTDLKVTTLAAGKYHIYGVICVPSGTTIVTFKAGNRSILTIEGTKNNWVAGSADFVLAKETDITFIGGDASHGLDFVYIQTLGTPTDEELAEAQALDRAADYRDVKISANGLSTFATDVALNFADVTGLTAYVVSSVSVDAVMLTPVTELPANQGVILQGTANETYSIPVVATADAPATNLLKAAVAATAIEANAAYVLKDGLFHLVTAASTVPAGKAYLLANDVPGEARSLGFIFGGDETTGIEQVANAGAQGMQFFDLQGRRVVAPQSGLYIVNGKKVVIK